MPQKKTYRAQIEFKADADETGEFEAVFSTFDVIDHHGDVTRRGAFHDGQETLIEPWNHDWGLPVGKGVIRQDDEKAWVEGKFFLETQAGVDHYQVAKSLGSILEWSYTFDIEESRRGQFEEQDVRYLEKLDVWGVSPVTRGAGIDTGTRFIKNQPGSGEESPDESQNSGGEEGQDPATSDEDEAVEDGKSSDAELMRLYVEIVGLGAGTDPAEA